MKGHVNMVQLRGWRVSIREIDGAAELTVHCEKLGKSKTVTVTRRDMLRDPQALLRANTALMESFLPELRELT